MHERNFLLVEALASGLGNLLLKHGSVTYATGLSHAITALDSLIRLNGLITDLALPDGSGLDVVAQFRNMYPIAPALILTASADQTILTRAYELRAACMPAPLDATHVNRFARSKPIGLDTLTEREREVIWHLSVGHVTKEIAYDLGLADSTVRVFLRRAAAKLGARSRTDLLEKMAAIISPRLKKRLPGKP